MPPIPIPTSKSIPYTAISFSIVGRFIFMYLLYRNKSTNSLSLLFCILNMISSGLWIYYGIRIDDTPIVVRSSTELSLLLVSSVYIIRNKVIQHTQTIPVTSLGDKP